MVVTVATEIRISFAVLRFTLCFVLKLFKFLLADRSVEVFSGFVTLNVMLPRQLI